MNRRCKHGLIGLDIGTSGVRMLQLSDRDGEPLVQAAAHYEYASELSGPDERLEVLRGFVREALATQPFSGREVVTALGTSEFQMKNIRLPRMPAEELDGAVQFEAQDRFDFSGRQAQYRYLPAGEVRHGNEIKEEVIVFAVDEELVLQRLELLKSLNLQPAAMDITPCAIARSFVRFLRRSEDVSAVNIFLEFGRTGTSVVITRGTELSFLKVIDIGGEQMNAAVARSLNLTKEEAAELRVRIMHESAVCRASDRPCVPEEIRSRALDAVRPIVERISRDVQLCLRYFAVTFRGQRPDSVTLVGGEAHEPAIRQIFASTIDIPCTIGHPMRGVGRAELTASRDDRTLQPAWTVAMGLALRDSPWVRVSRRTPALSSVAE